MLKLHFFLGVLITIMLMSNPAKAMDADKEESDITFGG